MDIRLLLAAGTILSGMVLILATSSLAPWLGFSWRKTVAPVACVACITCLTWFLLALYLHDPSYRP